MAEFLVKLINRTQGTDYWTKRALIEDHLQALFDEVFAGTSDSAFVGWGVARASDDLVIHFVEDVPSSYLRQQLRNITLRPFIGGHTSHRGAITGTEVYKFALLNGKRTELSPSQVARLAFHEGMHNKTGMDDAQLADPNQGGAGLGTTPVGSRLTEKNKEVMRAAMARKNRQLL